MAVILSICSSASTLADESDAARDIRKNPDRMESEQIAGWDFGINEDQKRDGWPDGWTRTIGQNYPKFIPVSILRDNATAEELARIEQLRRLAALGMVAYQQSKWPWQVNLESPPPSIDAWIEKTLLNPYLHIQMDGGAVELSSPLVEIEGHSLYYASARVKGDTPDFGASFKLRFFDSSKSQLFEVESKTIPYNKDWVSIATQTNYEFNSDIRYVQAIIGVSPKDAKAYRGKFAFDAVHIMRSPRLRLSVDKPFHVYRTNERVIVQCVATGISSEQPSILLKLYDHTGERVYQASQQFVPEESTTERHAAEARSVWHGTCEWKLPPLQSGYYQVCTELARGKTGSLELKESFVVIDADGFGRTDNRFGWSMTERENKTPTSRDIARLVEVVREARVGRLKLPIWFDNLSPDSARAFQERIDRLQSAGIQCVGVIASPPDSIRKRSPRLDSNESGIALEDAVLVQSYLEPVMRQMCLRLVDFQVGWDHETDFIANPRLASSLDSIRKLIRRYGQEAQMTASHNPHLPTPAIAGIDRWQLHSTEELTESETKELIRESKSEGKVLKPLWMSVTPLRASRYSLDVRVQDLASRMIATSASNGPNTVSWVTDPSDEQTGLIDSTGNPRELFLPFRTLSGALAGMKSAGSIPVPALGINTIVEAADQGRLIAWSSRPSVAQLFLGKDVVARDIWGRQVPIEAIQTPQGMEQRLTIGKWPVIVENIDINVAKWRMGIQLMDRKVDPVIGQLQELRIQFANPLGKSAVGVVRVIAPTIFAEVPSTSFEIEPNSSGIISIPVRVLPDADTIDSPITLDFSMSGESSSRFSIGEHLQIGTDDFEFEVEYQFDDQNQLWVTVEAINNRSIPTSFDCMLLIPGRARERTQIANLKDRTTRTFILKDASDLISETIWLRCEQIGTRRIENKRIVIQP
jgi:hypothetical protein